MQKCMLTVGHGVLLDECHYPMLPIRGKYVTARCRCGQGLAQDET